ncbi:MAG: hypothetical protein QG625_1554 [Cyanobacteriota bacterium erpe_2018_sw_39hr_WHONDRS-SW48-000098_B_bin.30]|jgi:hypothetical protein|nr:hypothetical protein [Cyanobacteriota bacterium erpe_2018_sw_39hr_WHONDRS-SW48-000098_B_bin.30]
MSAHLLVFPTSLPKTYADWQASLDKLDLPVKILTDGLVETSERLQVDIQVEGRPAFIECYFEDPNSLNKTLDALLRPTIDGRAICLDFVYHSTGLASSLALTAALMADYGALCYVDFASHGFVDIEEVLRDFRANPQDEPPPERLGPVNPEKQKRLDDALEAAKAALEVLSKAAVQTRNVKAKRKSVKKLYLLVKVALILYIATNVMIAFNPLFFWQKVPMLKQLAGGWIFTIKEVRTWSREKVLKELGKPDEIGCSHLGEEVLVYHVDLGLMCLSIRIKDNKVKGLHLRDEPYF